MNERLHGNDPNASQPARDPVAEGYARRSWIGWLGIMVLLANAVATAVVVLAFTATAHVASRGVFPFYFYAFVGSLIISVGGSLTLSILRRSLWWLLVIPWAFVLIAVLVAISRAAGMASMH